VNGCFSAADSVFQFDSRVAARSSDYTAPRRNMRIHKKHLVLLHFGVWTSLPLLDTFSRLTNYRLHAHLIQVADWALQAPTH
jgi:hypothetical protein